jgi:hypothetical protein
VHDFRIHRTRTQCLTQDTAQIDPPQTDNQISSLNGFPTSISKLIERFAHVPRVIARNNRVGLKIGQHLPVGLLNQGDTIDPILLIKITSANQEQWII